MDGEGERGGEGWEGSEWESGCVMVGYGAEEWGGGGGEGEKATSHSTSYHTFNELLRIQ